MTLTEAFEQELVGLVRLAHGFESFAGCCSCGWRPTHYPRSGNQEQRVFEKHVDLEVSRWVDWLRGMSTHD